MEFSLGGMMASSAQAADMYSDYNQEVIQQGSIAYGFIGQAVQGYAMDQLMDAFWASDWSEADDLYRGLPSGRRVRDLGLAKGRSRLGRMGGWLPGSGRVGSIALRARLRV
jgi:hypothetical protein